MRRGQLNYFIVSALFLASCHRSAQQCPPKQFSCGPRDRCIPDYAVCDGRNDCRNGLDEANCTPSGGQCSDTQFRCENGKCISKTLVCDRIYHCEDLSDEKNCPCHPDDFRCNNGYCIPKQQRCDGIHQCQDGSDEVKCNLTKCEPYEWRCDDGTCIDQTERCNLEPTCPDRSDEIGCNACEHDQFRCNNGTCLNLNKRCDNVPDCPHSEDEEGCATNCDQDKFTCSNGQCIDRNMRCNRIFDCSDHSDEANCNGWNVPCIANTWKCEDQKKCVSSCKICDGTFDCDDHSDESHCSLPGYTDTTEVVRIGFSPCEENYIKCREGYCIESYKECNGYRDCPSGSDEENCLTTTTTAVPVIVDAACAAKEYRCNDGMCIDILYFCDGIHDCLDKSDEAKCDLDLDVCAADEVLCGDGSCVVGKKCDRIGDCLDRFDELGCVGFCDISEFRCGNGKCIPDKLRCDGNHDCLDFSDEQDCVDACPGDQFRCNNGLCLDGIRRCDGYDDCPEGTDEIGCSFQNQTESPTCTKEQFDCQDSCIELNFRCDGYEDCSNGNDEKDCNVCNGDQFKCVVDQICISPEQKCDGFDDCSDGSDERDCTAPPRKTCNSNQFTCRDGACIDNFKQCDSIMDCPDGSDEHDCGCQSNEFECNNDLSCIPVTDRCNGRRDCSDGSDESNCPTLPPPQPDTTYHPIFRCTNVYEKPCASNDQCAVFCDGKIDCYDFSDEVNCTNTSKDLNLKVYPNKTEQTERAEIVLTCRDEGALRARVHWTRPNGVPLPPGSTDFLGRLTIPNVRIEDSGIYLCVVSDIFPDNTPNTKVPVSVNIVRRPIRTTPPSVCNALDQATCASGDCIPKSKLRDGHYDCPDGSDEDGYRPDGCEPNEFMCSNRKCVLKTWRCDADDDCGDYSDEQNCVTNPPGSICEYHQFACRSNNQCIPKSYQCDTQSDCVDGSDEVGCSKPVISVSPPPMVKLNVGETFVVTCRAIGIPTPEIVWRLNWKHVPSKCVMTSNNGVGTLTCTNIQIEDQGAYSCESINIKGATFAVPDTILTVTGRNPCTQGYFNVQARTEEECIKCFCFGHSTTCRSADLFTFQFQPPFDSLKILGVHVFSNGAVEIRDEPIFTITEPQLTPLGAQGVLATVPEGSNLNQPDVIPYFALPQNYHGNQLKSYGGYIQYSIRHSNRGTLLQGPNIIITGNGYTLLHISSHSPAPNTVENIRVRLFESEWVEISARSREKLATREEIMMVLENVDNILIKLQYNEGTLNTSINNIEMDSAGLSNVGLGPASYVEECTCPVGYTGTSCETCSAGYSRQQNGAWLGLCTKEPLQCPPGMYNDGRECQICPCPHTTPGNQFGKTCQLGSDGDVVCNCPPGYVGNRCQYCAPGYEGNPLVSGDSCKRVRPRPPPSYCDPAGSVDPTPDQYGRCKCKDLADGPTCNQCKANSFYLNSQTQFGCLSCFCMGVTTQCSSSNWYRDQISTSFISSSHDLKLVKNFGNQLSSITTDIRLDSESRQISYSDYSPSDVYYWLLPSRYHGNKLTSYGGFLRYTLRNTPIPGGQSSRNNIADVIFVSKNNINLKYYNHNQTQQNPNEAQTFAVPILEKYWENLDGQETDREHLLMVLADLQAIYIKATYFTNTQELALISISLDIANQRNTGFLDRALEVEQCHCPANYTGLSCENCDVGFTRTTTGLYLGLCIACDCNGYSNECDPETGICFNCKDGTTGDYCDECLPGYTGDPSNGLPCTYVGTPTCNCDPRGSTSLECRDGRCSCKVNVEGNNCDRCRRGSFGLNSSSIDGCEFCFCSGIGSECSESDYYIEQIPYQIIELNHNFTITDQHFQTRFKDNFVVNDYRNEISHVFLPSNRETLYWSLPSPFTGNRIKSYGGKLEYSQMYTQRPQARYVPDKDVIIYGNGITIFWSNPNEQRAEIVNSVSVHIHPTANWFRLEQNVGQRPASREDILTALAKVEYILIRATQSSDTSNAFLSDITLDTAVEQYTDNGKASSVEVCRCPHGYEGSSCEYCDAGFYRDRYVDESRPLGTCSKCPCNDNEETCELGPNQRVVCHCKPEFTGPNCENEVQYTTTTEIPDPTTQQELTIEVIVEDTNIGIYEVGSTVRYNCSAKSKYIAGPPKVLWSKENGDLPSRAIDDGRGLLVITDLRVSDSGRYICHANDGYSIVQSGVDLQVGVPHDEIPRIALSQAFVDVNEGQSMEIQCVGSGVPAPEMSIVRADGRPLSSSQRFENGMFRIYQSQLSDSGEYTCIASNRVGTDYGRFTIAVHEVSVGPIIRVDISPPSYTGQVGDTIVLRCTSSVFGQSIRWNKQGGDLPYNFREDRGTLIIANATPDVSGTYICTITSTSGTSGSNKATVTITGRDEGRFPTAVVSTERITLNQGGSTDIQCTATGVPPPSVKWTKLGGDLGNNAQQFGSTLNLRNVAVEDRGVYVCVSTNAHGIAQASVIVEVSMLETPRLEIYPSSSQTVIAGNSAVIQCRAVAGIPSPKISWSRENNLPLSVNVEEMTGGVLRFLQITPLEEGEYICNAVNEAGSATASAHIVVHTPPDVTITPRQELISRGEGDSLRLQCEATGTPQPSVVWSKYGTDKYYTLINENFNRLSNVAYQEFTHLTKADEGVYVCKAESSAGIVEKRVQLVVDTYPIRGDITDRPNTGEDPTSSGNRPGWKDNEQGNVSYTTTYRPDNPTNNEQFTAALGGRAELRCSIGNDQGLQFDASWSRIDGAPLPANSIQRSGILYIDDVKPEAQGEYRCTGIDNKGRTVFTVNTYLEVIFPPRITLIPPRQVVHPGEHAYINCSATGGQPIEITWSPINRDMPRSVYTRDGYIRFNNIQLQDTGRYLCTAKNRVGKAEAVADVIVEEYIISRPAIQAEQKQQQTPIGSTVTLRCRVNNLNYAGSIRWFREGPELPVDSQQSGETLYLRSVRSEDQGRYYCEIQTRNGTISDYVDLIILGPEPTAPPPYLPPDNTIYIAPQETDHYVGENLEVYCQSSERGVVPMWSKVTGHLSNNVVSVTGSLKIVSLTTDNAGVYRCEVNGRQGVQYKDYNVNVIDRQYKDQAPIQIKQAQRGSTVLLECKTDFDATDYVWTKQGGELPKGVDEFSKIIQLNDVDGSDASAYTCTASNGDRSIDIPVILVVTGIVPYFTQAPNSYITVPTLSDSYIQFNFEISFKPQQDTGLILYNGNKGNDISGDYISLSLVGGVPEFKYNLGTGTTVVRAERPITIGDWHTIKISRKRKSVSMFVDGDAPIVAVAEGKYTGLDLTEPMYLGGVPSSNGISPEVFGYEQYHGFVGCISRFKVGHSHVDILREALNKTGITTCESCSDSKCQNQGACQEALSKEGYMCICSSGFSGPTCNKLKGEACSPHACGVGRCIDKENGFECQCPLGRAGRRCEKEITVIEPAFQNDAYIAYPTPKPARKLKLTLKIKPNSLEDGILLYCSESEEGYGNFISLAIRDRHLEFRFDAGNGITVIRDESDLEPGNWHVLTATRSLGEGKLMIDGQAPTIGRSPSNYKTINLQTPLYIGGYDKQHIRVHEGVKVYSGFNGCIGDINLAGIEINMVQNITDSANVRDCSGDYNEDDNNISQDNTERPFRHVSCSVRPCQNNGQCYPLSPTDYQCACAPGFTGKNCETPENVCEPNPCQNQGTCTLKNSQYVCDCELGYTGRNCEQITELRNDAHFDGNGYLEFSRDLLDHRTSEQEIIALELSTNQSNGLIFWHGQSPEDQGIKHDHIALAIRKGYLEYSFDLGEGAVIIRNEKRRIDDGDRHSVILKRYGKRGSIEIDNTWLEEGEAKGAKTYLDAEGSIYLGGIPNISRVTENRFLQGFNGCIHGFELQNSQRLDLGMKAINGLNVKPCSSFLYRDIWSNDLVN